MNHIFDDVFKFSKAEKILLNENLIPDFENYEDWGINNQTKVFSNIISYETAVNEDIGLECINQKCYSSENYIFEICKSCRKLLYVQPKYMPTRLLPKALEISDDQLSYIEKRAFSNLFIETLIIKSFADSFAFDSKIFEGLSTLKNLIFMTAPILFYEFDINTLKNLEHLVISFDLSDTVKLYKVIEPLINLKSLITRKHGSPYFCTNTNDYKNNKKLRYLQYQISSFTRIPTKSFECLQELNTLIITDGFLSSFDTDAFGGLENLDTLILDYNKITSIEANTFIGLKKLRKLSLSHNSISSIYDGAFRLQDGDYSLPDCMTEKKNAIYCRPETLSVLDLSFNNIKTITDNMFSAFFFINIQIVLSNTICFRWKHLHPVCKTDDGKFIQYKPEYESSMGDQIKYRDNSIDVIRNYAFVDYQDILEFRTYSKVLVLDLADSSIIIEPYAIALKGLERLEITSGPVQLESESFQELSNLQHLKLHVNETLVDIGQVLKNLPNLTSLELLDNHTIGICDSSNDPVQIKILQYTGGFIESVSSESFEYFLETGSFKNLKCLIVDLGKNRLEHIENFEFNNSRIITLLLDDNFIRESVDKTKWERESITCYFSEKFCFHICQTNKVLFRVIERIMPYRLLTKTLILEDSDMILTKDNIFYNLTIKNLVIESSAKPFQLIAESLKGLPELENLQLSNSIEFIEDGAFTKLNNHLSFLDLSQNKLHTISDKVFEGILSIDRLDLSHNDIIHFESNPEKPGLVYAYNNSQLFSVGGSKKFKVKLFCRNDNLWIICMNGTIATSITLNHFDSTLNDAWKNIDSQFTIKSLILNKNIRDGLALSLNSFDGLSKLENLELNVGPTILERGAFYRLSKMNRLKIEVDITERLNNNEITAFDMGSLTTINNNYTLINVSYNKIVTIPKGTFGNMTCKIFDIQENPLLSHTKNIMGSPANINDLIVRKGHRIRYGEYSKNTDDEPQRKYSSWMRHGKDCHGKFILFGSKYKPAPCRKASSYGLQ
ncbi:chaoptin-like [Aphidius gifuensis]|uniref:chaoptin-like n=1 Tax=Aphidius gifuensis TaxID=684658 RepID=UPI001CDB539B|nr:chaoptin-like [Aphidius gifuensis]